MRSVRGSWPWQQAFANKPHGQISSSARSSSSQAASAQAASTWNRVEPLVLGHFPDTSPSLPRFFTRCPRSAVARYLPGTGRCQVCRVCQVAWVLRDVQGGPIRPVRGLFPRLASAANRTHPVVGVATRSNREQMSGSITISLVRVPSNVGGHRRWFECPRCAPHNPQATWHTWNTRHIWRNGSAKLKGNRCLTRML